MLLDIGPCKFQSFSTQESQTYWGAAVGFISSPHQRQGKQQLPDRCSLTQGPGDQLSCDWAEIPAAEREGVGAPLPSPHSRLHKRHMHRHGHHSPANWFWLHLSLAWHRQGEAGAEGGGLGQRRLFPFMA